jgi:hypothetical protein
VTTKPPVPLSTFAVIDAVNAHTDLGLRHDDSPPYKESKWNLKPGTYVLFGEVRRVAVDFTGTCVGTGQRVSGVVTSWDVPGEGALNCDEVPSDEERASDAASEARAACP